MRLAATKKKTVRTSRDKLSYSNATQLSAWLKSKEGTDALRKQGVGPIPNLDATAVQQIMALWGPTETEPWSLQENGLFGPEAKQANKKTKASKKKRDRAKRLGALSTIKHNCQVLQSASTLCPTPSSFRIKFGLIVRGVCREGQTPSSNDWTEC